MSDHIEQSIADLENKLRAQLALANETKRAINLLCQVSGQPERYQIGDTDNGGQILSVQSDTFYGKPLNVAMRDYLNMRRAQSRGAATVNEIFESLKSGGFKFQASNDENAKAGIRQSLTKQPEIFHRLPNGEYGLLVWYPSAKIEREQKTEAKSKKADEPAKDAPKAPAGKRTVKDFGWAEEIDKTLKGATKPLNSAEIAADILSRHPKIDSPHADAIVRKNLGQKGVGMGWTKDGDGWKKVVTKPGAAQGETRE